MRKVTILISAMCLAMTPVAYAADEDARLNDPVIPTQFAARAQSSPHTYALIISGGSDPKSNESKYWNDCSFIYSTLRKAYGVPKENIQVLMSDGDNPAEDLNVGDFLEPEYISSPLDLDGDGIPDINYPATRECLKKAIDKFAGQLTDNDHLLVFVTDHGGGGSMPTICLWNNTFVYADEFNEYFNGVNAGYISFVLGQCYSGGFTKYLKADNRIIMTACEEGMRSYRSEKVPYDEFLYQLVSCLNGYDPYGNKIRTSAMPTMKEAFDYATANDTYAQGSAKWFETPTISILENSTAEELTLATVPPVVDICIDNSANDKFSDRQNLNVTLLNADEEKVNAYNFDPQSNLPKQAKAELRIYNRGVKEYKGDGVSISIYGSKASLIASPEEISQSADNVMSVTEALTETIKPGEYISKDMRCELKNRSLYPVGRTNYVALVNDGINADNWNTAAKGRFSKLAKQNMFEIKYGNDNTIAISKPETAGNGKSYSLVIEESLENEKSLFDVADINLFNGINDYNINNSEANFSDDIANTFVKKGIKVNGNAEISNVRFDENDSSNLSIECDFHALKKTTTESAYKFCVAMYDEETGKCVGEQVFTARKSPRKAINISVDDGKVGETEHYLQISSASEGSLEYLWFNEDGIYIGEGDKIRAPYSGKNETFTAVAKSMADGCVGKAECMVNFYSIIRAVSKDASTQRCTLNFRYPTDSELMLTVAPMGATSQAETFSIPKGSRTFSFQCSGFGSRIYVVSLFSNGKMIESHKFNL